MLLVFLLMLLVAVFSLACAAILLSRFIVRQHAINEALADYVAADLLKTWEASAEKLVKKIREPGK